MQLHPTHTFGLPVWKCWSSFSHFFSSSAATSVMSPSLRFCRLFSCFRNFDREFSINVPFTFWKRSPNKRLLHPWNQSSNSVWNATGCGDKLFFICDVLQCLAESTMATNWSKNDYTFRKFRRFITVKKKKIIVDIWVHFFTNLLLNEMSKCGRHTFFFISAPEKKNSYLG